MLSKDVKAIIKTAEKSGYRMQVLKAIEEVTEKQKEILYHKLMRYFSNDLEGKTIAMWGLAFKLDPDDMCEAPTLV